MNVALDALPNPYDFANPVSDQRLFAGRRSELSDIAYYIELASKTDNPINLALLGERASGKTSLLNMIEQAAEKTGMLPVRIDLDESDVVSQFALFIKVFNAVLTAACTRFDAFGGTAAKTFEVYLDVISTLHVPDEKTFCPFLFPVQYARVHSAGHHAIVPVFDDFLKQDLRMIRDETNRTFLLLFDECNVLAESRPLLEKLRNIFMNMPRFMLVFAGTPELFPALDHVFSPISRQFKRIEVQGFKKQDETRDCIRKPLDSLPPGIPTTLFDFASQAQVHEIHRLTGGRPYEIQLVCHAMFRRVQEHRTERMVLDASVLEDVRRDLVRAQSPDRKAILLRIQELSDDELKALVVLCGVAKRLTVEQAQDIELLFHGEDRIASEFVKLATSKFIRDELLAVDEEGYVSFLGDEFDFTYLRYLVAERGFGKMLVRRGMPLESSISFELLLFALDAGIEGVLGETRAEGEKEKGRGIGKESALELLEEIANPSDDTDLFREKEAVMKRLYDMLFEQPMALEAVVWSCELRLEWWTGAFTGYSYKTGPHWEQDRIREAFSTLAQRAEALGGTLRLKESLVPLPDRAVVLGKLRGSENDRFRKEAAERQTDWMRLSYLEGKVELAAEHADVIIQLDVELEAGEYNNIGYLRLSQRRFEEAMTMLGRGLARIGREDDGFGLLSYNRGITRAMEGDQSGALEDFEAVAAWAEGRASSVTTAGCLFVLRGENGSMFMDEVRETPDLRVLSADAVRFLQDCTGIGAAPAGEARPSNGR
jgi:tetratricopeptide (TPR) repeat protein